jgi:hypothetical protein
MFPWVKPHLEGLSGEEVLLLKANYVPRGTRLSEMGDGLRI